MVDDFNPIYRNYIPYCDSLADNYCSLANFLSMEISNRKEIMEKLYYIIIYKRYRKTENIWFEKGQQSHIIIG